MIIARIIGVATLLVSILCVALFSLGYPRLQGAIPSSSIKWVGAKSYVVQVAEPTGWGGLFQLTTDRPEDTRASGLMLLENGVALGPAHTSHADVANGGGAFSHWGDKLYFSSTTGDDPRTNGRQYYVIAPYKPAGWIWLGAIATALISLAAVLALTPQRVRTRLRAFVVRIGPYALYGATGAGILVWLVSSCFYLKETQDLKASSIKATGGFGYVASVPFRNGAAPFLQAATDNAGGAGSLAVVLTEDGRPLAMPLSYVSNIEGSGAGRFRFYNGQLYFSASDNSDPRINGRTYSVESRLVFPVALQTVVYLLAAASLLLVARRRPAMVCGALAACAFAAALVGALSNFDLISHEEFVSRANVSHSIDQTYSFEIHGAVAPFVGIAPVGSPTKIEFGDILVHCELQPGSLLGVTEDSGGGCAPRSYGTAVDVVFPTRAKSEVEGFSYVYPVRIHSYLVVALIVVGAIFALVAYARPTARQIWFGGGILVGVLGGLLIAANVAGNFIPLRAEMPREQVEGIRLGPPRLSFEAAQAQLLWKQADTPDSYAARANTVIYESMIHGDVATDLSRWRLEVPVWENWVLHLLGVIEPKLKSYRFWDYQKELERGIGMCGHLSSVLVGYLTANGVPARIVGLSGHMVVTAEVAPGVWHLFDPDYGVVIRHSLDVVEREPALIEAIYAGEDDVTRRAIANYYSSKADNSIDRAGREGFYTSWGDTAEEYQARENAAKTLKWAVPLGLVLLGAWMLTMGRLAGRHRRKGVTADPTAAVGALVSDS